jgi:RNA polymerase sigma factor (sigma-70 family)
MANLSTRALFRTVQTLTHSQVSGLSDRELLHRFVSDNDQTAFAAIVTRHSGMVLGVCRRTLSSIHDAEDACQAVFLLLAKKANSTQWRSSVANWLYITARNVAHNARVSADRRIVRENQTAIPEAFTPVDSMTVGELSAILDEELDKLPPRYREPLVLCYLEGLTRDEAATQLAVPEATLKSQLERGRKKLAQALTSRGCTLGMTLLVTATTFRATAASPKLLDSILASLSGKPSDSVAALLKEVSGKGMRTKMKLFLLSGFCFSILALGLMSAQSTSTPKEKTEPKSEIENRDNSAVQQLGSTKFRADSDIRDARYSSDGKKIIGYGGNKLYVWDAQSGELLRKIDTKLEIDPDLASFEDEGTSFVVHPKVNRIACGGRKEGKTILQIWDYGSGKLLVEKPSNCDELKRLAWTADGKRLLERINVGWKEMATGWKLIVRNDQLEELHSHDLPKSEHFWRPLLVPLPNNKEVVLWQNNQQPIILDLESGATVLAIDYLPAEENSDVGISPDGKTMIATSPKEMSLFELPSGKKGKQIPVLPNYQTKPCPIFSPDSKTLYVWDGHPTAYEVDTGKQKWKAKSSTFFGKGMKLCDLSKDGSTILLCVGRSLGFLDAKTGIERNPNTSPCSPASMIWSPDGKILFTRADQYATERTWTAWNVATGKQLYYLQPSPLQDDQWQMFSNLFFLSGGKELLVGLERTDICGQLTSDQFADKEILVFDTATGQPKRKFCERLTLKEFPSMKLIGIDEENCNIIIQIYEENNQGHLEYFTFRWDSLKRRKLQEWKVEGNRFEPTGYYDPYYVTSVPAIGSIGSDPLKPNPAKIHCYSLTDGKLIHELITGFAFNHLCGIQGNFLLSESYNTDWVRHTRRYAVEPPIAYDYWELPSREKIRLSEQEKFSMVALGPKGEYVVRIRDNHSFEIYEPLVLKKAVVKVNTPSGVNQWEFSPDGSRLAGSLSDTTILIWDTAPWRKEISEQITKAVPKDLTPLWDDLAKEVKTALRASRLLSFAGEKGVSFLEEKIPMKKPLDEAKVTRFIQDLESEQFAVREKAEKDLRELSNQAELYLRQALDKGPSAEVKQRIEKLIQEIEAQKLTSSERREIRAVQAMKWMNTDAARKLLTKWSQGDPIATLSKAAKEALIR